MVSTSGDLLRWFQALSGDDQLPKKLLEQVFVKTNTRKTLGHWEHFDIHDTPTIQMNGANNFGYIAKVLYLPETDITVILAFNAHSSEHGVRTIHQISHNVIMPVIITNGKRLDKSIRSLH